MFGPTFTAPNGAQANVWTNDSKVARQFFFIQQLLPSSGDSPGGCTTFWPETLAPSGCAAFDGFTCEAYNDNAPVPLALIIGICAGFVALVLLIVIISCICRVCCDVASCVCCWCCLAEEAKAAY